MNNNDALKKITDFQDYYLEKIKYSIVYLGPVDAKLNTFMMRHFLKLEVRT